MAVKELNALGLRCPQPVLKIASLVPQMQAGDILRATADCPTFEADVRTWAERMKKTVLAVTRDGAAVTVQIQF